MKRVFVILLVLLLAFAGCDMLDPEAQRHFDNGNKQSDLGYYASAIRSYDRAIEIEPEFKFAYNNRGLAKHENGQYAKAIADFTVAIRLAPDDASAADSYYNRARSFHELGRHEEALADLDMAIELNPDDAAYYYNRAVAKRNLWQREDALIDLETALVVAKSSGNTDLVALIEERLDDLGSE